MSALYRHRPTVVRAIRYVPESEAAVALFLDERWPGRYQFSADGSHLVIETPEGDRDCNAADGYWIVEGVAHELYCVRPDVFARVYEPVVMAAAGVDTRRPTPPYGTKERAEWNAAHPDDERSRVPGSGGA